MTKKVRLKQKGLVKRIVAAGMESLQGFREVWTGEPQKFTIDGINTRRGSFIVIRDGQNYWDDITEKDRTDLLNKNNGDEIIARKYIGTLGITQNLTHEVFHEFSNNELPLWFLECGVSFYQRKIVSEGLDTPYLMFSHHLERESVYAQLELQFKEDVHRLFFGQDIGVAKKEAILNSVSKERLAILFRNY